MRYVIFDRDGTLIKYKPYLHKPEDVKLTDGSKEIVSSFLAKGYLLFLHTNQSGIGRGYYKMEDVINYAIIDQKVKNAKSFTLLKNK